MTQSWHSGAEPEKYVWRTSEATARRASDAIARARMVLSFEEIAAHRYLAIRLSDGSCDDIVYDNRADAIRHQLHETLCVYFRVPLERIGAKTADVILWYARMRYEAGYRAEVDGPELVLPNLAEGFAR